MAKSTRDTGSIGGAHHAGPQSRLESAAHYREYAAQLRDLADGEPDVVSIVRANCGSGARSYVASKSTSACSNERRSPNNTARRSANNASIIYNSSESRRAIFHRAPGSVTDLLGPLAPGEVIQHVRKAIDNTPLADAGFKLVSPRRGHRRAMLRATASTQELGVPPRRELERKRAAQQSAAIGPPPHHPNAACAGAAPRR